jgi:hypothetical protein
LLFLQVSHLFLQTPIMHGTFFCLLHLLV